MGLRTLVISCGAPAVKKYRIFNASKHLLKDEVQIFDVNAEIDNLSEARQTDIKRIADKMGMDDLPAFLSFWIQDQEPFDQIWTNDHREDVVIMCNYLQKRDGSRLIADVDDLFTQIPRYNQSTLAWGMRRKQAYRDLLEMAENTVVSTPRLQEEFGGTVCPNFIVPEEWEGLEISPNRREGGKFSEDVVICCPAGTGRAGDYLEMEVPLMEAIEEGAKLWCIGWMPDWVQRNELVPGKHVVYSNWADINDYTQALTWGAPDIIMSPMQHNEFNKAKSNLKWLEAGAVGAVFVGERWGEYERTVEDKVDGFLCDGLEEWTDTLKTLVRREDLRRTVAARGTKSVIDDWTWDSVASSWKDGVNADSGKTSTSASPRQTSGEVSTQEGLLSP